MIMTKLTTIYLFNMKKAWLYQIDSLGFQRFEQVCPGRFALQPTLTT